MRADAERDRATALAERNRIGREIHDVLAHSLGALSVQLEAADALLENGTDAAAVRPLLRQARRFAVEGLSDLLEQRIVAGQRDDFDAQRVRSTRLVSERGRRLRMCINAHGYCRQRNAPVLMPSYCAWFDGDPTAKCR